MDTPERIETDRLVLRRPAAGDAEMIFSRYAGDPEVTHFLGWPTHRSPADSREFVAFSDAEWSRWPAGPYVIEERATGRLVGEVHVEVGHLASRTMSVPVADLGPSRSRA